MKPLFRLSLLLLLSLAAACQSSPSTPAASVEEPAKPTVVQPAAVQSVNYDSSVAAARANPEFIRDTMFTINGQRHHETTT